MELMIEGAEGVSDSSIISIRAGSIRRQAPLNSISADRPFRFPCAPEECGSVKVDFFDHVGSARGLVNAGQTKYTVHCDAKGARRSGYPSEDVGKRMQVSFSVRPAGKDPSGDAEERERRKKDVSDTMEPYLEKHKILSFLQGILQGLIKEKPEHPYRFIANQFDAKASDQLAESPAAEKPTEQPQPAEEAPAQEEAPVQAPMEGSAPKPASQGEDILQHVRKTMSNPRDLARALQTLEAPAASEEQQAAEEEEEEETGAEELAADEGAKADCLAALEEAIDQDDQAAEEDARADCLAALEEAVDQDDRAAEEGARMDCLAALEEAIDQDDKAAEEGARADCLAALEEAIDQDDRAAEEGARADCLAALEEAIDQDDRAAEEGARADCLAALEVAAAEEDEAAERGARADCLAALEGACQQEVSAAEAECLQALAAEQASPAEPPQRLAEAQAAVDQLFAAEDAERQGPAGQATLEARQRAREALAVAFAVQEPAIQQEDKTVAVQEEPEVDESDEDEGIRIRAREVLIDSAMSGQLESVLNQAQMLEDLRAQARSALMESVENGELEIVLASCLDAAETEAGASDEKSTSEDLREQVKDVLVKSSENGELAKVLGDIAGKANDVEAEAHTAEVGEEDEEAAEAALSAFEEKKIAQVEDEENAEAALKALDARKIVRPADEAAQSKLEALDELRTSAKEALLAGAENGMLDQILADLVDQKEDDSAGELRSLEELRRVMSESFLQAHEEGMLDELIGSNSVSQFARPQEETFRLQSSARQLAELALEKSQLMQEVATLSAMVDQARITRNTLSQTVELANTRGSSMGVTR